MKAALIIMSVMAAVFAAAIIFAIIFGKNNAKKNILLRYYLVFVLVGAFFAVVIYRIWYLQNTEGEKLRAIAEKRWTSPDTIRAKRGNILSDDGRLMASSLPTYDLFMDMRVAALKVKGKNETETYFEKHVGELAEALADLFKDKSAAQYEKELRNAYKRKTARHRIYPKPVSYIEYLKVSKFPILERGEIQGGFYVEERVTRKNPFGSLASRTIGSVYEKNNRGGKNGLELKYDSILRGHEGLMITRKMAGLRTNMIIKQPVDGLDIVSTINIDLQETVEKALLTELQRVEAENGTAILMETATGEVKAISNFVRNANGGYSERINVAVSSQIDPGSTFKLLSCMVALDDGVIDTCTVVNTEDGSHRFANRLMKDWNYGGAKGGFGEITLSEAMYQSSNVGISVLINEHYGKQPEKFIEGLKRTGITNPVNLELPGHGRVVINEPGSPKWSLTSLPWMSIGYEVQVPPIFTLMMYNAVANNGRMMKPIFAKGVQKNGVTVKTFEPEVVCEKVCSDETLGKLHDILEGVVEKGTAKQARSDMFKIAGKTGTSQIFEAGTNKNAEGRTRHQITFCGYFPADKPLYSCIVYIKEPKGPASAGRMCGKVFKQIAEKAYILESRRQYEADSIATVRNLSGIADEETNRAEIIAAGLVPGQESDSDGKVPDVRDLSASEATYLLENLGMKVALNGIGRVHSQSVPAGSDIKDGMEISLALE